MMTTLPSILYALIPATITFREHGVSIKGTIYYWNEKTKKIHSLHEKAIEDLRRLVRNDVMLKIDLTYLGSTYSVLGTLTSLVSRKKISVVLYLYYRFNGEDVLNFIFSFLREKLPVKGKKNVPMHPFILNIREAIRVRKKETKEAKENKQDEWKSRGENRKTLTRRLHGKASRQTKEVKGKNPAGTSSGRETHRTVRKAEGKVSSES